MDSLIQTLGEMMVGAGGLFLTLLILSGLVFGAATAWNKVGRKVHGIYQDELLRSILRRNRAEFLEWLQERGGQAAPRGNGSQEVNIKLDNLKKKLEEQLRRSEGYIAQYTVGVEKSKKHSEIAGCWSGKRDAYVEQRVWLKEVLKDGWN